MLFEVSPDTLDDKPELEERGLFVGAPVVTVRDEEDEGGVGSDDLLVDVVVKLVVETEFFFWGDEVEGPFAALVVKVLPFVVSPLDEGADEFAEREVVDGAEVVDIDEGEELDPEATLPDSPQA